MSGRVRRANGNTKAAKWNSAVLRRLRERLDHDPEKDIVDMLTPAYSNHLEFWKQAAAGPDAQDGVPPKDASPEGESSMLDPVSILRFDDVRSDLYDATDVNVLSPITAQLLTLFHGVCICQGIKNMLARGKIVYRALSTIFIVDSKFAVKVSPKNLITEHNMLNYVHYHLKDFPAPKAHGLVQLGGYHIMFSTHVPGYTLQEAWPELNLGDRHKISIQLGDIVRRLRTVQHCQGNPLGGVWGEGCKDARYDVRDAELTIRSVTDFENWLYTASQCTRPCVAFVNGLIDKDEGAAVFLSHGDLIPENIIVRQTEEETWQIEAVVDWDSSGFYPEYWEAFKATHGVHTTLGFEWSHYIPDIISPRRYPTRWMADRLLERGMEHA
ncbi:hypothetical protein CDD82_3122 [Ophiocordyceps australis]|uniref:Aminoglycoside phosphotransferase domain-containing protein n=1 Tax=Ophiocordyceps australis TaxID=1399860 RepID=A0A2C5ZQ30_9HYPO|nr:hypothetical protein CDD82_3122 [Ophiocordyceps australis]